MAYILRKRTKISDTSMIHNNCKLSSIDLFSIVKWDEKKIKFEFTFKDLKLQFDFLLINETWIQLKYFHYGSLSTRSSFREQTFLLPLLLFFSCAFYLCLSVFVCEWDHHCDKKVANSTKYVDCVPWTSSIGLKQPVLWAVTLSILQISILFSLDFPYPTPPN